MLGTADTRMWLDHPTFTIHFLRWLAAPRDLVFAAWTHPEHVRRWWDPTGMPLDECQIDLRPGGSFLFRNQGDAHSPPFGGVYQVIESPALLVFEAMGATGTVELEPEGDGTRMHVSIRCVSGEHLEHFVKLGVADGTGRTLDNLVEHMRSLAAR